MNQNRWPGAIVLASIAVSLGYAVATIGPNLINIVYIAVYGIFCVWLTHITINRLL